MKRVKLYMGLVVLVLTVFVQSAIFCAEFTGDVKQSGMGMNTQSKLYFKDGKMRMESPQGIMIIDSSKGTGVMLSPADKMYFEMPGQELLSKMGQQNEEAEKELAKVADKKLVGKETVNGYECDKYKIVYKDKQLGSMTQWISKELMYPVKSIYKSLYGEMTSDLVNVKKGSVSDSLFEIPAGYQKMQMPDLTAGME